MIKNGTWIFNQSYLSKKQAEKELATWNRDELINHVIELRSQLNNQAIKQYEEGVLTKISHKDYRQEWSYPNKIRFLIEWQNKPLTSLEIHSLLMQLDKRFKYLQRPVTTLSGLLTRTHQSKRINKYKVNGKSELYFILPNWIDKQGNLLDTYSKEITFY